MIEKCLEICRKEFPLGSIVSQSSQQEASVSNRNTETEAVGFYVLLSFMIDSVIRDQWLTFCIASAGVLIMLLFATRHPLHSFIAVVPNLFPILMVLGLLGWLEVKMNMGVALIAAVSIGMSVDSSIHYIIFFQRARMSGKSILDSILQVQQRVGRAMVFSTIAIIIGFGTLCFSPFTPTVYFGSLSILAMVGGLIGNLFVLPMLLFAFSTEIDVAETDLDVIGAEQANT